MSLTQKIWSVYFAMVGIFTIYGAAFTDFKYRSIFFNFGRGLVWPLTTFPMFGYLGGAVVFIIAVGAIVLWEARSPQTSSEGEVVDPSDK